MRVVERCYHKQTSYAHGRFWWLEITSNPGFWHGCSPSCPKRCDWNVKLRLALTWLNIPFAVTGTLGFASKNGQFELRPALSIQHVVRNTSPGFKALFLCKIDVLSLEESKQRLRDLYRSDGHFKYHVNPAGESYIRVSYTICRVTLRQAALTFGSISSLTRGKTRISSSSY